MQFDSVHINIKNINVISVALGIIAFCISAFLLYFIYRLIQYVTSNQDHYENYDKISNYKTTTDHHGEMDQNHHHQTKYVSFNEKTPLLDKI